MPRGDPAADELCHEGRRPPCAALVGAPSPHGRPHGSRGRGRGSFLNQPTPGGWGPPLTSRLSFHSESVRHAF